MLRCVSQTYNSHEQRTPTDAPQNRLRGLSVGTEHTIAIFNNDFSHTNAYYATKAKANCVTNINR